MTAEADLVWHVARKYLRHYGRWKRIENPMTTGFPDLNYTLLVPRGQQGWMELKLFDVIGRAPPHFTREQIMWGEEEVKYGGAWHLFGRCGPIWVMYDVVEARKLFEREESCPLFQLSGRFPVRELLHAITPRPAT